VHWRRFDAELVVLDLDGGHYYGLSEVGADAFEMIARGEPLPSVVAALLDKYEVDRERLEDDLRRLTERLVRRGLLEVDP
jgi:hypothetical protein